MEIFLDSQLKALLEKHHLSVAQLSRATNIPSKTLYQWTYGHHPRNFRQVYEVAKYFRVSLEFLIFGQDTNVPEHDFNCGLYEVLVIRKLNNKEE